jgi:hypothetical protein
MAVILPTTPIEMPDLAGQAFKLQEYRAGQRQEQAAQQRDEADKRRARYGIDKAYGEAGNIGQLMPRYRPTVQAAFDEYISKGEQLAYSGMDTDRNAFLESQAKFNALLGSAQAKSEIGLKNINSFYNTPSEFAVTGEQFVNLLDNFNSQAAGEEELMDVTTAFRIPTSEKLKFMQPNELAQEAVGVILGPKKSDFSPDGVSFNKSQAINFAQNQWLPSMLTPGSDAYNKAIIYGARKTGWKGLNNRELSAADVEEIRTLPQDQKDLLVGEYVNDTMNQIRQSVPNSIGEYDKEKEVRSDEIKKYENLKPADTGVQIGKLVITKATKENPKEKRTFTPTEKSKTVPMYELPGDAWIKTRNHTIVGFGKTTEKINGKYANIPYIRTIRKDEDTGEEVREVRRATLEDLSVLKNKMKDTYYDYFDN